MLDAVLFDLDGTLLDTVDDFMAIILSMRQERDLPDSPLHLIRSTVSDGSAGMLCAAFSITPEHDDFAGLRDEFLERYQQHLAVHTRPFPGIDDLLDWLDTEGLPWGVVTNKMSRFSIPLLQATGLAQRCASLVCPDQVSRGKPHPDPLFKACTEMRVTPTRSVYIGDHLRDIQAGRAAGMRTVAALYGYLPPGDDPQQWNADFTIENVAALRPWLEQLKQQELHHV
ncbi:MAG: HAD-IA family hydrolase [Pseudomonas sp.]